MNDIAGGPPERGIAKVALRALVVSAVVGAALLVWYLNSLLLLVFGALLVAVILNAAASGLKRLLPMPMGLAIALAFVLILGLIGVTLYVFGAEVSSQMSQLIQQIPTGVEGLRQLLGADRFDRMLQDLVPSSGAVFNFIQTVFGYVISILTGLVLAVLGGVYLSIDPDGYRRGLAHLFPHRARPALMEALDATGATLRFWLLGQLAAMTCVGVLTYIGLSIIGVPSPLALALIAALLDFIPMVGPFLAAGPAILVALTLGVETAALTAGLYLIVQQIEGNILQPVFMKKAVDLPPALTLFGLFLAGAIFGPVGVILGGPITVTVFVLVRKLWVERVIGDDLGKG